MISLENESITVTFVAKGAELQSITNKTSGLSYLWKGDPAFWGKFSPVLFPIVGGLKDDTYIFDNKDYHLPRHGFARDHEFEFQQISDREVLFTLSSNAETLKVYPFEFTLGLRYQISGNSLSCSYEVSNSGEQDMLFSVGGHPAFAAPLTEDTNYEDYYIEFDSDEAITYHKIADNLISDETETIRLDEGKLHLKHELFYNDALVFKSLKSNSLHLRNTKNKHGLDFHFPDFPYFGIWAAKDADFVCLEPWCGIADGVNHNQQLSDKEGVTSLSPGGNWKRTWEVAVF
jgi:galactose mutarotase-like enzyme